MSAGLKLIVSLPVSFFQVAEPVSTPPESCRCKGDLENILGIVGIVGTFLNLLVVVLVYIYTPI